MKLRLRTEIERARSRARRPHDPRRPRLDRALAELELAHIGTIHSLCGGPAARAAGRGGRRSLVRDRGRRRAERALRPGLRPLVPARAGRSARGRAPDPPAERLRGAAGAAARGGLAAGRAARLRGGLAARSASIAPPCSTRRWPGWTSCAPLADQRGRCPTTGWPRASPRWRAGRTSWTGASSCAAATTTAWRPSCASWPTSYRTRAWTYRGRPARRAVRPSRHPGRGHRAARRDQGGRSTGRWPCARPTWPPACARTCAPLVARIRGGQGGGGQAGLRRPAAARRATCIRDAPDVRRELQRRFSHVLIDEFQDTDPLQAEILLLLAADDPDRARLDPRRPGARQAVRGGRPQAVDLPLSPRRHRRCTRASRTACARPAPRWCSCSANFRSVPALQQAVNGAFAPRHARRARARAGRIRAACARCARPSPGSRRWSRCPSRRPTRTTGATWPATATSSAPAPTPSPPSSTGWWASSGWKVLDAQGGSGAGRGPPRLPAVPPPAELRRRHHPPRGARAGGPAAAARAGGRPRLRRARGGGGHAQRALAPSSGRRTSSRSTPPCAARCSASRTRSCWSGGTPWDRCTRSRRRWPRSRAQRRSPRWRRAGPARAPAPRPQPRAHRRHHPAAAGGHPRPRRHRHLAQRRAGAGQRPAGGRPGPALRGRRRQLVPRLRRPPARPGRAQRGGRRPGAGGRLGRGAHHDRAQGQGPRVPGGGPGRPHRRRTSAAPPPHRARARACAWSRWPAASPPSCASARPRCWSATPPSPSA